VQLRPLFNNRFLNLEVCRRKTVICQFPPCKQQKLLLLPDRSIAMTSRPGHVHPCPIAHKSTQTYSILLVCIFLCHFRINLHQTRTQYSNEGPQHCNSSIFITRQHTDAWYWYSNSVCPSLCLSVCLSVRNVPVLDENGLTYRHSFFTIRLPNNSSFTSIKHLHEIPTGSPLQGR